MHKYRTNIRNILFFLYISLIGEKFVLEIHGNICKIWTGNLWNLCAKNICFASFLLKKWGTGLFKKYIPSKFTILFVFIRSSPQPPVWNLLLEVVLFVMYTFFMLKSVLLVTKKSFFNSSSNYLFLSHFEISNINPLHVDFGLHGNCHHFYNF